MNLIELGFLGAFLEKGVGRFTMRWPLPSQSVRRSSGITAGLREHLSVQDVPMHTALGYHAPEADADVIADAQQHIRRIAVPEAVA